MWSNTSLRGREAKPWRSLFLPILLAFALLTLAPGRAPFASSQAGATFHLVKTRGRWWIEGPHGKVFVLAVSGVNSDQNGDAGGFLTYDGVFLQSAGAKWSRNLTLEAQSSSASDIVFLSPSETAHYVGDTLYLGSSRFRPQFTYFWLGHLGAGGAMRWYYSTAHAWKEINGSGNPFSGAPRDNGPSILDADGAYNLDIGGYMAPDAKGFGEWNNPNANRVSWWDVSKGLPPDFARQTIPPDNTPRYYIKGIVAKTFAIAPLLNQTYERATLNDTILKKYSPGAERDPYGPWAAAQTERLRAWGFNAVGQYSYRYMQAGPSLKHAMPALGIWQLSGWATRQDYPYHVKNVYAGAVCPPGGKDYIYEGNTADAFEPQFEAAFRKLAKSSTADTPGDRVLWGLLPEEADDLFGLNAKDHAHMAYVILSQNPHLVSDPRFGVRYGDPQFYAKFAFRDFLKKRYAGRVEQLNEAWGTTYSTWDTSSGDIRQGTNAYGTGSGFMDENGSHVYYPRDRSCQGGTYIQYDHSFTNPAHPAVRRDLDDFVRFFAARYGQVLQSALAGVRHPPVFLPLYSGIDDAYSALGPYVDGFWTHPIDVADAKRIYEKGHKPIIVSNYDSANPDSQLYFNAPISSVKFDRSTNVSSISANGIHYWFRSPWQVTFPASPAFRKGGACERGTDPNPRIAAHDWNSVELPGDYSSCVRPGERIVLYVPPFQSQAGRVKSMAAQLNSMVNLTGPDGVRFVVGFEHWTLYDDAVSNWGEINNFGLVTLQDNAYDGVEARRKMAIDGAGRMIGGEEADYGNLLGPLSVYLKAVPAALR